MSDHNAYFKYYLKFLIKLKNFCFFQVYRGCWKDTDIRDLPIYDLYNPSVTLKLCIKQCSQLYYKYVGLQFGYVDRNDQN